MPRPNPFRTWLQLVRAPNLLTVPGDPLAGYLLACFGVVEEKLWNAIGASLCFYAGGLLLNDLADVAEDRRDRPQRPIPSGAASSAAVGAGLAVLFGVGLWLCWTIDPVAFATGGALLLAIVLYNLLTKRIPVIGPLNMGLCRGLSVLLGATAVAHGDLTYRLLAAGRLDHVLIPVLIVTAYIAAVTNLARGETHTRVPRFAKWLPALVLTAGAYAFLRRFHLQTSLPGTPLFFITLVTVLLFLVSVINAFQVAVRLDSDSATPVAPEIGRLIRLMLLVQAAFCASNAALGAFFNDTPAYTATLVLVMFWPLSRLLSRWFYAS